ncbi:MAG: YbjN domain-containing protein [Xanthobacteraceae bacterium]
MNRLTLGLLAAALALMGAASKAQETGNRISAGLVADELRDLGYSAKIDQDESGDPRVNTKVDGYDWSVYFYDCGTGPLAERTCVSFQFYSGYNVAKTFPQQTINKWNTEKRYAKAYTYVQRDRTNNARIEVDVLMEGTGADPKQAFRAYFTKMKNAAEAFRKAIDFK